MATTTTAKCALEELKPYPALKKKFYDEMKELVEQYKHLTINSAAKQLGIDPTNLRTLAYRMGIPFERSNGNGKTKVDEMARKRHITLPKSPWE